MKLYIVSTKYGRNPFQGAAFVDAKSPKEAILIYCGGEDKLAENIAEGFRYRATITTLPKYFWEEADYMRLEYIQAY